MEGGNTGTNSWQLESDLQGQPVIFLVYILSVFNAQDKYLALSLSSDGGEGVDSTHLFLELNQTSL